MEFDIGTLLYIVITLVAVIIGLLGKRKKNGGDQGQEDRSSGEGGFLENLERTLAFGEEGQRGVDTMGLEDQTVEEASEYESFADDPEESEGMSMMEEYSRYLNGEGDRDSDRISAQESPEEDQLEVIDLDEETGTDYFDIVRDFDATTAVIYAAIINRVDY